MLYKIIAIIQVVSALSIIGVVLIQHGKGADMGAAFGSGASGSLFGATGSSNFLSKSTAIAAVIFFSATLAMSYIGYQRPVVEGGGVLEKLQSVPASTVPMAPAQQDVPPVSRDAASGLSSIPGAQPAGKTSE